MESDSDNLLTQELDQIGRLTFPLISLYVPTLPSLPTMKTLPALPAPSKLRDEISKYLSTYNTEATKEQLVQLRAAVGTRIQMANFLHDLDVGLSISTAIERLQPLTDIIHEAITLPVDDDELPEKEQYTEPVVVQRVVEAETSAMTELVIPENDQPPARRRHRRRRKEVPRVLSDDNSELDGLTADEVRALTHLDSLDDFYKQDLLRSKIQSINRQDLPQESKNKLVTRLMMGNYHKFAGEQHEEEEEVSDAVASDVPSHSEAVASDGASDGDDEVILTEADTQPSYHDKLKNILGCSHYQTNCKVECPQCLRWFTCRFCHDEVSDHKLVRNEIKHVLCMFCNTPQEPEDNYCVNCEKELAEYFCATCKLYDNDPNKDIYHCDKCGICRLGLGIGKDYFHCDECNICLSIQLKERHKCLSNTTHCDCPVCNEYLFTSVSKVVFMKCGHLIHEACYEELSKHSYKCPLCKKTVANVETQFRILDQEIRQQPMPPPYNLWRCIIGCNDCKGKSNVAYHVLGLKCKYCSLYNTNQIKLMKPGDDDANEDSGESRINTIRLMKTSLLNNFRIDDQHEGSTTEPGYDGEADDLDLDDVIDFRRLKDPGSSLTAMFQSFINRAMNYKEDELVGGF